MSIKEEIRKRGGCIGAYQLYDWFSILMEKYNSFLEIGTYKGAGISVLAKNHKNKQFVVVDNFCNGSNTISGNKEMFLSNCYGLSNIKLLEGFSVEILPTIKEKFDLIFIDGDHIYTVIKKDLENCYNLILEKGKIVVHDYDVIPDVAKAVDEFSKNSGKSFDICRSGVIFQF